MKKGDKFVLLLLSFVALLMVATIGYRFLSERYTPQEVPITQVENDALSEVSTTNTSDDSSDSAESTKVPDFTVYDLNGNAFSLYENLGKPIVLNFWATWCGPCQSEMPAFDLMYQQYGDQITFLMVNVTDGSRDTAESVAAFYEDSGYTFPIYLDTTLEAASAYGAYSIPMTFFIDPEGNLLYYQMGAMSADTLAGCMELLLRTSPEAVTE